MNKKVEHSNNASKSGIIGIIKVGQKTKVFIKNARKKLISFRKASSRRIKTLELAIVKKNKNNKSVLQTLKKLDTFEKTAGKKLKNISVPIKPLAIVSIFLIVFSISYQILEEWNRNAGYEIDQRSEALLFDKVPEYSVFISEDTESNKIEFNQGYTPGIDKAGQSYEPKYSASFDKNPSGGISINDPTNQVSVTIKPKFRMKTPQRDDNRLVYPILGADSVKVVTLSAIGYKEDIILTEYDTETVSYEYELELPKGVEARLETDGSLGFYGVDSTLLGDVTAATDKDKQLLEQALENGEKNNLLFRSPAPVIIEQKHVPSSAQTWYTLEGNILTLHASDLSNANYPISIDPSIYVETAAKLMRGNNETNVDFDVTNELIKKSFTTGARFDSWNNTMNLNDGRWNHGTAVAGGYIYVVGGEQSSANTTSYTVAGSDTFVVPAGVTSVTVKMWGAGGGGGGSGTASNDGDGGAGGGGAFTQATLTVTPAETLDVYVGGGGGAGAFSSGSSGSNSGDAGGGGGRSYVERSGTPLIVAAGGGGGGGGDNSSSTAGGDGGAGGGSTGENGGASSSAPGGSGATDTTGGSGGNGSGQDGASGGSEYGGAGGDGGNNGCGTGSMNNGGNPNGGDGGRGDECGNGFGGGGGGGDGYYGGGGGSASISGNAGGGGGGGGASHTTGTATTETGGSGSVPGNDTDGERGGAGDGGTGGSAPQGSGTAGDDGKVIISYTVAGSGPKADVYWAQLSTTNNSIVSPNPGAGACTEWCTNSAYDLPDERVGFSLVAYNGFLYAIGGEDDTGTRQSTVYIAKLGANGEPSLWHPTDSNKNNWVYWYPSTNTLTDATSYGAATVYNNRLYLLGGQTNSSSGGVTTVYEADFDPTGDIESWTTTGMTALPSARHMHSVHVYNDYLYLIGGNNNGTLQSSVYYNKINDDGTLNTWVATNSFATARATWGGTYSVIWGGYVYLMGGCSAVNGSGYCTTIQDDIQLASINSDGSLGPFSAISGITSQRIGYGFTAWDNGIYRIGGCAAQNTSNGQCTTPINQEDYGVINPAGEVSTVSISEPSGTSPCSGGSPYNCDLPPAGDDAGEGGQMLSATTILNGYLYVIGGCIDYNCSGTNPAGDDSNVSGNILYVAVNSNGDLSQPSTCIDSYYGAWCVDSTNRVNGTTGTAASGIATFDNRIYLVGGLTGSGNHGNIYYNSVNEDGSLAGSWSSQTLSSAGISSNIAYTYAYARANPTSASTNPGNLFVFGGCSSTNQAGCNGNYETEVYKCSITISGSVSGCSTSGQTQIDSDPDTGGSQGLGIHSGTVYANYIYLIGGYSNTEPDKDEVMIAKFDDSNNVVEADGAGTTSWTESPNTLSIGRRRGWAFGYNGHIYSVGGYEAGGAGVIPFIEWSKLDVSTGNIDPFITSAVTINQRWGLSVTVSNSYAYVIGGCDVGDSPNGCSSFEPSVQTFQLYNNDSGTATGYSASSNQFGTDRYGASAVIRNGYIYLAGGCTDTVGDCSTTSNNVQYAPISTEGVVGTWSSTTGNLPAARGWGQLEKAGGTLYWIGGQDSAGDEKSDVYYATPSSSTGDISSWSTASNGLPADRTQFSAANWNDRLYVVAGLDDSAAETNTVYISPQLTGGGNITSAWSSDTDVPDVARSGNTVVAYANNLYTFGGHDGSNYLLDGQFAQINSDGTVDAWTYTTQLPSAIRQADGFAANGYMYIIGGRSDDTTCQSSTLVAPISANTTIPSGNNPTGVGEWFETNQRYIGERYGNAAVYDQGKAYILGGGCIVPPTTVVYDTAGNDTFNVPGGVSSITVKAWGAGGGGGAVGSNGNGGNGGGGGFSQATLSVTASETLNIYIGSAGTGGTTSGNAGGGGGGGGHSEINRSGTNLIIAAGGGGGGGGDNSSGTSGGAGGAGGGSSGVAGSNSSSSTGGGAGTSGSGGSAGSGANNGTVGGPESAGDGGNGGSGGNGTGGENNGGQADDGDGGSAVNNYGAGGGGGGGLYGGGGGGSAIGGDAGGGGGGGGSGYVTGSSTTLTAGSGTTPGNSGDSDRAGAGNAGGGGTSGGGGDGSDGIIIITYGTASFSLTGSNRTVQTTVLSQPQVAKYSRLIDTDTDVFPTKFLMNGLDNDIGARWEVKYSSSTDATSSWGQETDFGEVTLGTVNDYTPLDSGGSDTEFARFYFFWIEIDASRTFGYPDDVSRGPTLNDITLFFTSDPGKRLRHGKTFTGGEKQPLDTPPGP